MLARTLRYKMAPVAIYITLQFLALVAGTFPVQARETDPGPDPITWFFGGTVQFKQLGVTCQLQFGVPKKYNPRQENFYYQPGMGLPPGSRVRLFALFDTGRKKLDAPVEVAINKDSGNGWEEPKKYDTTWLNVFLDTEHRKPGPLVIRVYGDGGRDRDNYDYIWVWIQAEDQLTLSTSSSTDASLLPSPTTAATPQPPPATTGNVKIVAPGGARVPYVSVWSNGQKIVGEPVQGIRYFQSVPAGRVTIRINSPGETWNLAPGVNLEQELKAGQTVEFNLVKGGR